MSARRGVGTRVEFPESFIDSINFDARSYSFAGLVGDGAVERNQWTGRLESSGHKPFIPLNVGGELFTEKPLGRNYIVCISQSLLNQIPQTGADGIPDQQSAGQYCDSRSYAKYDGQICAPVVSESSFDELAGPHTFADV